MTTLVMKFGGASVASAEQFSLIAAIVAERARQFDRIIVVVSAMGNTTDELLNLAKKVNPTPPKRELDMLVTVGERISCSLLAMALAKIGLPAISFTGSQSGIITCERHTEARVIEVRPHRLLPHIDQRKIAVVAGFQGVSKAGEITTLGRGGSDTTAVALGAALGAKRVEFFKDVPGIFEEDPKLNPRAKLLKNLNYDEALSLIVKSGHQVLHGRSIALAQKNTLPLQVLSFNEALGENSGLLGTLIGGPERTAYHAKYEDVE